MGLERFRGGPSAAGLDAAVAAFVGDTDTDTGAALSATFVSSPDIRNIVVAETAGEDPETLYITPEVTGGGGLLAVTAYNPETLTTYTRTGATTFTDVDATNAAITFTAPSSGKVLIEASAFARIDSAGNHHLWNLRDGAGDVAGTGVLVTRGTTSTERSTAGFYLTGLTAGQSYSYKLGFAVIASIRTATIECGGTAADARGPLLIKAMAAPA